MHNLKMRLAPMYPPSKPKLEHSHASEAFNMFLLNCIPTLHNHYLEFWVNHFLSFPTFAYIPK